MFKFILLVILTFAPLTTNVFANSFSGIVEDINGARISGAKILVFGNNRETQITTNSFGEFNIELNKGIYRVSVIKLGFFNLLRPNFALNKKHFSFKFILISSGIRDSFLVENNKAISELEEVDKPFQETLIKINKNFSLYVRYGDTSQQQNKIEYLGFDSTIYVSSAKSETIAVKKKQMVTAMYNNLTIVAESIIFDKIKNQITTKGKTTVDDGSNECVATKMIIDLSKNSPQINCSKK